MYHRVALLSGSAYAQSSSSSTLRSPAASINYFVYVGTYTGTKSKGIYGFRFDAKTGRFTSLGVITIFDIDRQTGKLTPTRQVFDGPSPVAVLFIPTK